MNKRTAERQPLQSMTGYAAAWRDTAAGRVSVELRSVNGRFLDLSLRLPDELRAVEPMLRERISAVVHRGKLECRVSLRAGQGLQTGQLDTAMLAQLASLQSAVHAAMPRAAPLAVADVLRWPGVVAEPAAAENLQALILQAADEALDAFVAARSREGAALAQTILSRAQAIEDIAADIASRAPELLAQHERKLVERLDAALQGALAQPTRPADGRSTAGISSELPRSASGIAPEEILARIRQEVTLHGMRIDIAEEVDRLRTHVAEVRHIVAGPGPAGKRLDFMLQELNREANTIGSKSAAIDLGKASVELKLLIEQIREQVQNVE